MLTFLYHGCKYGMYVLFAVMLFSYSEEVTDYVQFIEVVQFDACCRIRCQSISIVDDLVLEIVESFDLSLLRNSLDYSISLEPTFAKIEIIDNDG